jgi:hypothetical protein
MEGLLKERLRDRTKTSSKQANFEPVNESQAHLPEPYGGNGYSDAAGTPIQEPDAELFPRIYVYTKGEYEFAAKCALRSYPSALCFAFISR